MTEKEKKEYYRNRVERDLKGNPLSPNYKKPKVHSFPPPSDADAERMSKLDGYGNPLPGFEWRGRDIVKKNAIHVHTVSNEMDGTEVHRFPTIRVTSKRLVLKLQPKLKQDANRKNNKRESKRDGRRVKQKRK